MERCLLYSSLQASVAGPWLLLPTLVWTFGHLDSPGPGSATVERLSRCSHDHDLTAWWRTLGHVEVGGIDIHGDLSTSCKMES